MKSLVERLLRWPAKLRRPSGRSRQVVLGVAAVAFLVLALLSWREFPRDQATGVRWPVLLVAGVLGPSITIWLNASEFRLQAALAGQTRARADALRISVLSTAANLLPLPGAVLVRGQSLVAGGATLGRVAAITAGTGLLWLATSFFVGAIGLLANGLGAVGWGAAVAGLVCAGVGARTLATSPSDVVTPPLIGRLLCVEVGITVVSAVRFAVVLYGLGIRVTLFQGMAITVTGALANAAGVFPAGLGLREALTAGVSVLVDLPAAAGYAAAATDRIMGLSVLTLAAVVLMRVPQGVAAPN